MGKIELTISPERLQGGVRWEIDNPTLKGWTRSVQLEEVIQHPSYERASIEERNFSEAFVTINFRFHNLQGKDRY